TKPVTAGLNRTETITKICIYCIFIKNLYIDDQLKPHCFQGALNGTPYPGPRHAFKISYLELIKNRTTKYN
ncbi:hypothetical protein, partial [Pseudomonas syringae]|uniref:hypothetical protein n=1 Tax=Pseudomonas syringae TaxID=317 RepID=UPI001F33BBAF